jgi:DNA polymerase-3 subunit delta
MYVTMSTEPTVIYILYGADDFSSREALKAIKNGLGDAENLSSNTVELEGAKLAPGDLRATAEALPFFGSHRLVIIRGLLNRFDPPKKSGSSSPRTARGQATRAEVAQSFAGSMKHLPPSTVVVLLDGKIEETNPLLQALNGIAQVQQYTPLKENELRKWAGDRVRLMGSTISPQALNLLVKMVGSDLWIMSGEIDKLTLYAAGRQIETMDVECMVAASREASIFELVDSVMLGQRIQAQQVMLQLLRDGASPVYIIFMLTRQLRLLVLAKDMMMSRADAAEIQNKLGVSGFIYHKTAEQAVKYSMERLKVFYHALMEADIAIKTGKYDEELALTMLITELGGGT